MWTNLNLSHKHEANVNPIVQAFVTEYSERPYQMQYYPPEQAQTQIPYQKPRGDFTSAFSVL